MFTGGLFFNTHKPINHVRASQKNMPDWVTAEMYVPTGGAGKFFDISGGHIPTYGSELKMVILIPSTLQ